MMTKQLFLDGLKEKHSGLPKEDLAERLSFYGEMIDDLIEEGNTEEQAIQKIGTPDEVSSRILEEYPLSKIVKERIKPKRRLKTWEIVLIVLGSPVWLPLIISAFAVILFVYISIWAIIVLLWAVFVSIVASSAASIFAGIFFIATGHSLAGIATVGAGLFLAGLSIFTFFGCRAAVKGILCLTKKTVRSIKNLFLKNRGTKQ
ncbi:MAG: DUF1700 domain-containing protein [Clostridia bacterium]|nr:DUF1700 domain-containing protein [Clostridia bacterium]